MLNKIISRMNPTIENLEKELLNSKFDPSTAQSIIDSNKVNINTIGENGDTLLHKCLKNKKLKAAKWLVERGIKTNVKNADGISDLVMSVEKGNVPLVETLFRMKKATETYTDANGRTLLQDAVMSGQDQIVKYLLKRSININSQDNNLRSVVFDAIAYGCEDTINEIVTQEGINLNLKDIDGNTILHDQKVLSNDELAKKLLENGADPTILNGDGNNFLSHTALRGESGEAILDVAIKCGCDLNTKTVNNDSILMEVMYAFSKISKGEKTRRKGLKGVAKKLIHHGIDVNAINNNGETSLFDMVRVNDIEGCAFLLENKVPVNFRNNHDETALYIAVLHGIEYLDMIILLLEYGAKPTIKNKYGQSIPEVLNEIILHIHGFRKLENKEILEKINPMGNYLLILKEMLSKEAFDFNYLDSKGNPLIFLPFLSGDNKICQMYLQHGVDINLKNKEGLNLFYQYVQLVFEQGEYFEEFRERLVFLLINKANSNTKNGSGQNIYTKIALIKNCNLKLFRKLIEVTRYDYNSIDTMGRTIVHSCVWSGNLELLKLVYGVERNIQNIADKFNVLPITYAALFGNQEITLEFLRRNCILTSNKKIHILAKKKFQPLLKNLPKLTAGVKDADQLRNLKTLQEQVIRDLT